MDYNRTSPQLGTSETVIVQPDLSQGYNCTDFDKTNTTSLQLTWQPTRWDWLQTQLQRGLC